MPLNVSAGIRLLQEGTTKLTAPNRGHKVHSHCKQEFGRLLSSKAKDNPTASGHLILYLLISPVPLCLCAY